MPHETERLSYRYCSKNVSGYRLHLRYAVAYSAEVVHRAVPIRWSFKFSSLGRNSNNTILLSTLIIASKPYADNIYHLAITLTVILTVYITLGFTLFLSQNDARF